MGVEGGFFGEGLKLLIVMRCKKYEFDIYVYRSFYISEQIVKNLKYIQNSTTCVSGIECSQKSYNVTL